LKSSHFNWVLRNKEVLLPLLLIWGLAMVTQWDRVAMHKIITWDVFGYYLYLPASIIYGDLDTFLSVEYLREHYEFSHSIYQINEERMPIYTIGMAILYAPFFLLAHLFASITAFPADGLSLPYQWALVFGSLVWVSIGFVSVRKWLLNFLDESTINWTLIPILLGTNLLSYTIYESGMPHAYLWGLYGFVIWRIHLWVQKPNVFHSIIIGVAMGLLCLARPSEMVVGLLWLLYPYSLNGQSIWVWQKSWWNRYGSGFLMVLIAGFLVVLPQVAFWFWRTGSLIYNAYTEAGHQFHFLHPHIVEGFFSFRKGWLLYTPLMSISLVGIVLLWWKKVPAKWMTTSFFVINAYWVLSWHMWWYAGSFGMRALIQSYALLALPFGFAVQYLRRTKLSRRCLQVIILLFVLFNMFQTWQYIHRILPGDQITGAYYSKAFGAVKVDKKWFILLDHPEISPFSQDDYVPLLRLSAQDYEPVILRDSKYFQVVTQDRPYSMTIRVEDIVQKAQNGWVKATAHLYYIGEEFTEYNAPGLVIHQLSKQDENRKWVQVSIQRCLDEDVPDELSFDYELPSDSAPDDYLLFYLWNGSPDTIYLNSLELKIPATR